MKLWAGLGNPGAKYAGNRHNIGFMAVERIAADHGFSAWRSKFQAEISEGRLGSEKVLLLKPQTFMNLSGQSVRAALDFHKLESTDLTVFHDEIDLAPGKIRLKAGGGHAGHNGLRSIHDHIGPHYDRVRLGVGHPGRKEAVPGYVLHDFAKADQDWLDDLLRGISDGAADLASGDGGRFLNAVGLRMNPPRSGGAKGAAGAEPAATQRKPRPAPQAPKADSAPAPSSEGDAAPDSRSLLQRLADRFR